MAIVPLVLTGLLGAAAACGDETPMVTMSGTIVDVFTQQPLEEARFCRLATPNRGCSVSDAEGRFRLRLPANGEHWVTVDRDGYWPALVAVTTGDTDQETSGSVILAPEEIAQLAVADVGGTIEAGQGHMGALVYESRDGSSLAGVTLALDPKPVGLQAYMGDSGRYTLDATATGAPGAAVWLNIPPGDYVATLAHPERVCYALYAFPTGEPGSFRIKVLPDRATYLYAFCE